MTTTTLESVALLLDVLGLGTYNPASTGGTVFLDELPPEPDAAIAVAQYGAGESDSRLPYDTIAIQVRVRGAREDARAGAQLAQDVYDQLHGLGSRELPGGLWLCLCVGTQGGPIALGRDQTHRPEWTVNFRAEFHRPTPRRDR